MLHSLDGVRLKLQRAETQLETLKGEIAAFLDADPYEPAIQFLRMRGCGLPQTARLFTIRMLVKKQCPPMWSVAIGEICHNLRSALDHCVYQLVITRRAMHPPKKIALSSRSH